MQVLVLVPGLVCDDAVWSHQRRTLESDRPVHVAQHGQLDTLTAMAAHVLAWAPPRFAIAGHSMGGRVALEIWRQAPSRVTGLALLDTGCRPIAEGDAGARERQTRADLLALARRDGMRAMAREWVRGMVHPDRVTDSALTNGILDMFERQTPEVFAAQIGALLGRPDARSLLSTIDVPTLVLCGAQDAWAGPSASRELAAAIADSELDILDACGHMAPMECPEAVTSALRRWLHRVEAT